MTYKLGNLMAIDFKKITSWPSDINGRTGEIQLGLIDL
jgi:hypothetical protein